MTTLSRISRHTLKAGAIATVAALALTGCSTGAAGDDGDVTLTLTAWANADEAKMYEKVLDVFEEQNPGVTVNFEYTDVGK